MAKYKYFTENDLYAVGQLSKYKDLSMLPLASELKDRHTFSEAFERRIADIYRIFDQPTNTSKLVRRVLLVAAIITLLFALAMSASAICERVYELFFTYEDNNANGIFISMQLEDGSYIAGRADLSILYYPTYIPDGYKEADHFTEENTSNTVVFTNEQNQTIVFRQETIFTHFAIDTESTEAFKIVENGITYYCSQKEGFTTVIWNQNGYSFYLLCELSLDESIQIAKSLLAQ